MGGVEEGGGEWDKGETWRRGRREGGRSIEGEWAREREAGHRERVEERGVEGVMGEGNWGIGGGKRGNKVG